MPCSLAQYRTDILTTLGSYFGRNDDFMNSFWNLLTFSISTYDSQRNLDKIHVELKHFFLFFFQVTAILRVCRHRSKTCVCQLSQIHPYFSFFVPPQGTRMYFYKRTQKPVPLGTSNTLFHTAPEAEPRYKLKSIMKEQFYSYALTISRDFYPWFTYVTIHSERNFFLYIFIKTPEIVILRFD